MRNEIIQQYSTTNKRLLRLLSAFSQEQLNQAPAADSWSAGQVAVHLIKASVLKLLYGPICATTREPDQHVESLKQQFLDFTIKMKAPEFVLPEQTSYSKVDILRTLEEIGHEMETAITSLDLSATCSGTPPVLGELTRLELIWFNIFHTQRHMQQLECLLQTVGTKQNYQPTIT